MDYDIAMKDKDLNEFVENLVKAENRYYQEVVITDVKGKCPYGHQKGDSFKVTAMNSAGICGSLLKTIFGDIVTLHYGGVTLLEKDSDIINASCPEKGKVRVEIKRVEMNESEVLRTPWKFKPMTGKGYPALDKYKVCVEVTDIAVQCYWGHSVGDTFEVDPFNVGGACCFLYNQLYPYIHILLSGSVPAWSLDNHSMMGECPDVYDRLCFRLFVEER
jgi:uncharacterized repeat protein (TIGR04076 family)